MRGAWQRTKVTGGMLISLEYQLEVWFRLRFDSLFLARFFLFGLDVHSPSNEEIAEASWGGRRLKLKRVDIMKELKKQAIYTGMKDGGANGLKGSVNQ